MRVLIIEDSNRLRRTLKFGLQKLGFAVDEAADGHEGLQYAETYEYDVIILDLMLPGLDGLTLLRRFRHNDKKSHVLILSAKDQVKDRVLGLEYGADDYLVKPFSFDELVARINALVRRRYRVKNPYIKIGNLEIDTARKRAIHESTDVHLTPREYAMLEYLATRKGRVISRQILSEHLYDQYAELESNVVDVTVCTLRKKLKNSGLSDVVKTKRGFGYFIG